MNDGGNSMFPDPDRRYWRLTANRQVRKKRLTRNLVRLGAALSAHVLVAAAVLYVGTHVLHRLTTSKEFSVERIEIEGARRASREQIGALLAPYRDRNLLDLNLYEVAQQATQERWVASAAAKRVLPHTLRLSITERRPAAIALIDRRPYVVDATGAVVGEAGPAFHEALPVLSGLDGKSREELVAALRRGVGVVETLRETAGSFVEQISEIDLSRGDRLALHTVRPGPRLLLDPEDCARNIRNWLELDRAIRDRVGPADYVDLRWHGRIAVMPSRSSKPS